MVLTCYRQLGAGEGTSEGAVAHTLVLPLVSLLNVVHVESSIVIDVRSEVAMGTENR